MDLWVANNIWVCAAASLAERERGKYEKGRRPNATKLLQEPSRHIRTAMEDVDMVIPPFSLIPPVPRSEGSGRRACDE